MALFTVEVNGKKVVVEAATKAAAKSWGKSQVEIGVAPATAADINANEGDIITVEKKEPAAKAE